MADIAIDAATFGHDNGGASNHLTFQHTVTGDHTYLFVGAIGEYGSDLVTGATYNGRSMRLIGKVSGDPMQRWTYLFGLGNATPGTHDVVISTNASHFIQGFAVSYLNAQSSDVEDSTNTNSTQSDTSLSVSTNVQKANCWLIMAGRIRYTSYGPPVAGANTTRRIYDTDYNTTAMFDSNGPVSAGSHALAFTETSAGPMCGVIASLAPYDVNLAVCWGYATPDEGETSKSWITWKETDGDDVVVSGDPAYGALSVSISELVSDIIDTGDTSLKVFTVVRDKYDTGSGTVTYQIRGSNTLFSQLDGEPPSWQLMPSPPPNNYVQAAWRYVQLKIVPSV